MIDPSVHQQYYYPMASTMNTASAGPVYDYPVHQATTTDASGAAYVLPPSNHPTPQMVYYTAAPTTYYAAPTQQPAPMYYQQTTDALAAMSLGGGDMGRGMVQPQPTPVMHQPPSSTGSAGSASQPLKASTPIPPSECAVGAAMSPPSLSAPQPLNHAIIHYPMPPHHPYPAAHPSIHYQQMPTYYMAAPTGYAMGGAGAAYSAYGMNVPMSAAPTTAPVQQQQQQHAAVPMGYNQNRMLCTGEIVPLANGGTTSMSGAPEGTPSLGVPEEQPVDNIDNMSRISHQSSPDSVIEQPIMRGASATTPLVRRRLSLQPPTQLMSTHHMAPPLLVPSNYKTRLCTQWQSNRQCTMAAQCKFAHGTDELRLPDRPFRALNNPKYKTKMCKNFEKGANGICAYAERCEYIHPSDREYTVYKERMDALSRSRPFLNRLGGSRQDVQYEGRGGAGNGRPSDADDDNSVRSVMSEETSRDEGGRRVAYLGMNLPPAVTRSAVRVNGPVDLASTVHIKRGAVGGSMFNLHSSGQYYNNGGGNGGGAHADHDGGDRLFRGRGATMRAPSHMKRMGKLTRRSSLLNLNTAPPFNTWRSSEQLSENGH